MDSRKALDGQAIAWMVVLCMVWSLQQIVLKATAADIAPVMQIGLRSGAAAVLVGLVMLWRGERMPTAPEHLLARLAGRAPRSEQQPIPSQAHDPSCAIDPVQPVR